MKTPYLLLASLLLLSACDADPTNKPKASARNPATLVEITSATRPEVHRSIERNGSLRARREVAISVQQEGQLLQLPFHEGDHVEQGALLLQLDDTLLRAQLKKSQAQRQQAELDLKRLKRLQGSRAIAEEEIARASTNLEVARAEEEELRIRLQQTGIQAPFTGIISERLVEPGDALQRFQHALSLIDTSSLYTELQLSELLIPSLKPGDEVSITIDALGTQAFIGTIERIHPIIDEATRQGTIEVLLRSPPAGATPGQLCRVTLQIHSNAHVVVPYNALRRDTRGEFLFVVNSDNKVERRSIISGQHFDEMVEILDGLQEGESVVTQGFLGLTEGSSIKLASDKPNP